MAAGAKARSGGSNRKKFSKEATSKDDKQAKGKKKSMPGAAGKAKMNKKKPVKKGK